MLGKKRGRLLLEGVLKVLAAGLLSGPVAYGVSSHEGELDRKALHPHDFAVATGITLSSTVAFVLLANAFRAGARPLPCGKKVADLLQTWGVIVFIAFIFQSVKACQNGYAETGSKGVWEDAHHFLSVLTVAFHARWFVQLGVNMYQEKQKQVGAESVTLRREDNGHEALSPSPNTDDHISHEALLLYVRDSESDGGSCSATSHDDADDEQLQERFAWARALRDIVFIGSLPGLTEALCVFAMGFAVEIVGATEGFSAAVATATVGGQFVAMFFEWAKHVSQPSSETEQPLVGHS